MHLPTLLPGKRFGLPKPTGSSDALLIAHLANREKSKGLRLAVVTEQAQDAQRLLEEIQFFSPSLHCVLFPDWETLNTPFAEG